MNSVKIGKVYCCNLPGIKGDFEVEVLEKPKNGLVLVRVIRCTLEQRKFLKKFNYRFVVNSAYFIGQSLYF